MKYFILLILLVGSIVVNAQDFNGVWGGKVKIGKAKYKYSIALKYNEEYNSYSGVIKGEPLGLSKIHHKTFYTIIAGAIEILKNGDPDKKYLVIDKIGFIPPPKKYQVERISNTNSIFKPNRINPVYEDHDEHVQILELGDERLFSKKTKFGKLKTFRKLSLVSRNIEDNEMRSLTDQVMTSFTLDTFIYRDEEGNKEIDEKTYGKVAYYVTNHSSISYWGLKTSIAPLNISNSAISFNSIQNYYVDSAIKGSEWDIKPRNVIACNAYLAAGFNVPYDLVNLRINIESNRGIKIFGFKRSIPTKLKKIETDTIERFPERIKIINGYYGINTGIAQNISVSLDALVKAGDKKARLWKGIFTYLGKGGYEVNEQLSYQIIRSESGFDQILQLAKNNDKEAMFLVAMCCKIGAEGLGNEYADHYLDQSRHSGYIPAIYTKGLLAYDDKKYDQSYSNFELALKSGARIAEFSIAGFYESGALNIKDESRALEIYQKLASPEFPSAYLKISEFYSLGKSVSSNKDKAIEYALKAVQSNSNIAKVYLANLYLIEKTPEHFHEAVKLDMEASEAGNRDAMFNLGAVLLSGKMQEGPNSKGLDYIKNAAQLNQPNAMNLLGILYSEGKLVPKDLFLSRYWLNQAKVRGVGLGKDDEKIFHPMADFIKGVCDYTPTEYYEIVDQYNQVLSSGYKDDDAIFYAVSGLKNLFLESRRQKQEIVNDIRLIYTRNGVKTYGGIISSRLKLPEMVGSKSSIDIYASGSVNFGSFATIFNGGLIGPEGSNHPDLQTYNVVPEYPHGSILTSFNYDNYRYVGKQINNLVSNDKPSILNLMINDADYTNNAGYFDLRVDVY